MSLHRHRRRALALMLALQVALPHPQQRRLLDQALPQHPPRCLRLRARTWARLSRGCRVWPHRLLHVCRLHKALPRYPQHSRLLDPALQGPHRYQDRRLGLQIQRREGWRLLTEMEGRLQEHIGSLHAAVQECHSMIATVQMMQTMVQSSGRNLH